MGNCLTMLFGEPDWQPDFVVNPVVDPVANILAEIGLDQESFYIQQAHNLAEPPSLWDAPPVYDSGSDSDSGNYIILPPQPPVPSLPPQVHSDLSLDEWAVMFNTIQRNAHHFRIPVELLRVKYATAMLSFHVLKNAQMVELINSFLARTHRNYFLAEELRYLSTKDYPDMYIDDEDIVKVFGNLTKYLRKKPERDYRVWLLYRKIKEDMGDEYMLSEKTVREWVDLSCVVNDIERNLGPVREKCGDEFHGKLWQCVVMLGEHLKFCVQNDQIPLFSDRLYEFIGALLKCSPDGQNMPNRIQAARFAGDELCSGELWTALQEIYNNRGPRAEFVAQFQKLVAEIHTRIHCDIAEKTQESLA